MRGDGKTGGSQATTATAQADAENPIVDAADPATQDLLSALRHEADSSQDTSSSSPRQLDSMGFVLDVPVELTIELGRKLMKIGDVLRLAQGSVLELDKVNGESLDIYANNRLIARGDAVVIGERYGVRLTEVLVDEKSGPAERA